MQRPHFPSPLVGAALVGIAWVLALFLFTLQLDPSHVERSFDIGVVGIAMTLAFGLVATLAARRVPEPQAPRLGLVGFDARLAPALALLLPYVIVASEVDNWIAHLIPPADPQAVRDAIEAARESDTTLAIVQRALFLVGIQPVVVEWLLRGVVQQGAIAYLGRAAGVIFTAIVGIGTINAGGTTPLSWALLSVGSGALLGVVRVASGSLLAPILLHMGWNAIGVAAISLGDALPIPGFNQLDQSFTPPLLLLACTASAGLGFVLVARRLGAQPVVLPIEPDRPRDDD